MGRKMVGQCQQISPSLQNTEIGFILFKVWKMHTGVDIGAKWNEAIVAAADGIVIYAGTRGGYGNCIILIMAVVLLHYMRI